MWPGRKTQLFFHTFFSYWTVYIFRKFNSCLEKKNRLDMYRMYITHIYTYIYRERNGGSRRAEKKCRRYGRHLSMFNVPPSPLPPPPPQVLISLPSFFFYPHRMVERFAKGSEIFFHSEGKKGRESIEQERKMLERRNSHFFARKK